MNVGAQLRTAYNRLGWPERIFCVLLALYFLLLALAPLSGLFAFVRFIAVLVGIVVAVRLARLGIKRSIWRLRNRLLVTYLFIAVVPVLLIATLAGLAMWLLAGQFAVYLVTGELDRRIEALRWTAASVAHADPAARAGEAERAANFIRSTFPNAEIIAGNGRSDYRYPSGATATLPSGTWQPASGLLINGSRIYAYAYEKAAAGPVMVMAPLTPHYLSNLVPNLGVVRFWMLTKVDGEARGPQLKLGDDDVILKPTDDSPETADKMPPAIWRGDVEVRWASQISAARWDQGPNSSELILQVRSRPSAAFGALFSRGADKIQGFLPLALLVVSILFLVVELIALVIGVSMTRTITGAVHHLYEATVRVREGDFSHRIKVKGSDQLAELGHSFNVMTDRVEELLVVAKEKERLQSEIEIAREVQNQLYPKRTPDIKTLRLTAVCNPARMVSGDYFDYECIHNTKVAIAIGDVAGKGISAALLMATLQSSLRTELRASMEMATAAGDGARAVVLSSSSLVGHLNQQLYAYTSPEKYATFYLAIYDEPTGLLTYTNAGHLPPALIRKNGEVSRLNVDGTVVGAFPFAQYDESRVDLQPGDLLVCFTDGVTEPENVYGEMFGEDRLVDLVAKNAKRSEPEIVKIVSEAVQQWTGSPELQDDMTLLLARRL